MTILKSQLRITSSEFKERQASYKKFEKKAEDLIQSALTPASAEATKKTRERNKLLVEERLEKLFDPVSPILELMPLAGNDHYSGVPPGAGIRTAIGQINGRPCMVVANNAAIKGGTYFPLTVKKHLRAQEIALENALPCVYLVDSGGAFLPLQAEVFPDRNHFGRIFHNQAVMSAKGIPQISAVLGSCTAGGAYVPAMSDEVVMVRGNATIFLGGPPLVEAATGEKVTAEELGGADVHCQISGVADHLVENELEAIAKVRAIVSTLGSERTRLMPELAPEAPLYSPEELGGVLGGDFGFSALEVLARLLDGSRFKEFKAEYGKTIKCGFGHIYGYKVGIVINDGILFSESALKATHFISLCNERKIPLLFLQNIMGFMVGKKYEHQGIAKDGAKMVRAVATSRVPKLTVIIGGSFGAGNYAMCGRAYEPRYLFSWPNSKISVMGGKQAGTVLKIVGAKDADEIEEQYEREGGFEFSSSRIWDDGVLFPATTRETLALALSTIHYDQRFSLAEEPYRVGVYRM